MVSQLTHAFAQMDHVSLPLVAFALIFHVANFVLRSFAWRNVLRDAHPGERVPLTRVAGAYASGVAVNAFAPARGGDLVKVALVRTGLKNSSVPTVAATIGVIMAFDTLVGLAAIIGLWAFGFLPSLPAPPGMLNLVFGHPFFAGGITVAVAIPGLLLGRRMHGAVRSFVRKIAAGFAVLRSPRHYATAVVPFQATAWLCRISTAYFLLAAFGLHATVAAAIAVIVVGGISTIAPTPGGIGPQQVLLAYVLGATASTASVVSFSLAMQGLIMAVNTAIGITALMIIFGTFHPIRAARHGLHLSRFAPEPDTVI